VLYFWVCPLGAFVTFKCGTVIFSWYSYLICIYDIIHLLYAGEGNMQIYSSKSIIFPEGIARGHRPRGIWYSRFKILLTTFRHINMLHEDITYIQYYMTKWSYIITLRHINVLHEDITYIQCYMAKWSYIIKNIPAIFFMNNDNLL
jgi:hypothetical protein